MGKKTTIKDLASRTGTSVATVHRALHGMDGVSEHLREAILKEARKSNYVMDESASLLRRGGVHLVVLLPDAVNNERFYYQGVWQGIEAGAAELQKMKANIRLIRTEVGVDEISCALEELYDRLDNGEVKMDGLVTICDDEKTRLWLQRFIRRGVKVALLDRGMPISGLACSVETASEDIGKMAMELADLFRDRQLAAPILMLSGPSQRSSYRKYAEAALETARLIFSEENAPEIIKVHSADESETREIVRKTLKEKKIGAVLSASARTTFWACEEVERSIPSRDERPPVIGTDVFRELIPFFESGTLKASIYQSHVEFGQICLRCLFNRLVNPGLELEKRILNPLSIVMKGNFKYFIPGC